MDRLGGGRQVAIMMALMIRLLALVFPLSLDTFAVSAALGLGGLGPRQRLRLSLVFAAFEGGMPIAGLGLGALIGARLGASGRYLAIAALLLVGLWMLRGPDDDGAGTEVGTLRAPALVALGLSVSFDELAIGFTLGLLEVAILTAIALMAAQAFVATQLGARLGSRVGERFRAGIGRLAALALVALGLLLLASTFAPIPGLA